MRYYAGGFEAKMTRREAAQVLGIRESADAKRIKAAHRKILIANHPDKGGSPYMAAKVTPKNSATLVLTRMVSPIATYAQVQHKTGCQRAPLACLIRLQVPARALGREDGGGDKARVLVHLFNPKCFFVFFGTARRLMRPKRCSSRARKTSPGTEQKHEAGRRTRLRGHACPKI
jgi:hypothetical protein